MTSHLLALLLTVVPALSREIPLSITFRPEFEDSIKPVPQVSFDRYHTADEIHDYLVSLSRRYPEIAKLEEIGKSVEGRPIDALMISSSQPVGSNKPVVLIDAGIHAREWVAPASALYIINQLVDRYSVNRNITDLVDWIIVPLVNPDGYVYSMVEDRFWRKNRANTTDKWCQGVDLNRNFDVFFGVSGASKDPCDETYPGPNAFSEPESQAFRDLVNRYKNKIRMYLTLHSYGQFFLYPWGYEKKLPGDWKELDKLASKAGEALTAVYGTRYRVGSSGKLLGAASGGSDDWMKFASGIKFSYTIELPGGGFDGFDLPEEEIFGVVTELFPAIVEFTKHVSLTEKRQSV